jgi:acid phosphatase
VRSLFIPWLIYLPANIQSIAAKGITLTNYFAVTHSSEPNRIASVGGDYFGLGDDNFHQIPANVSTIVDLLEDKCISWSEYQEDMPFSGFEGFAWVNQRTGANDCKSTSLSDGSILTGADVRKHNTLIVYNFVI